jgi:hypothetical protein
LPIAANVAIEFDPSLPDFANSAAGAYLWSYPSAQVMQQAALKVFQRVFGQVGTAPGVQQPAVTLWITGSSLINPAMGDYYGRATATAFSGTDTSGSPIAEYRGEGKASATVYSLVGVQKAFEASFAEIANRMLADPAFLERVRD